MLTDNLTDFRPRYADLFIINVVTYSFRVGNRSLMPDTLVTLILLSFPEDKMVVGPAKPPEEASTKCPSLPKIKFGIGVRLVNWEKLCLRSAKQPSNENISLLMLRPSGWSNL